MPHTPAGLPDLGSLLSFEGDVVTGALRRNLNDLQPLCSSVGAFTGITQALVLWPGLLWSVHFLFLAVCGAADGLAGLGNVAHFTCLASIQPFLLTPPSLSGETTRELNLRTTQPQQLPAKPEFPLMQPVPPGAPGECWGSVAQGSCAQQLMHITVI